MLKNFLSRGVLYWLRAPRDYTAVRDEEWILAIARVLLSACYLTAVFRADSREARLLSEFLSLSCFVYSLVLIVALKLYRHASPFFHIGIHCADLLWAMSLVIVIDWPAMSLALFFFLIASAAVRWGFWEVLLTGMVFCVLLPADGSSFHLSVPHLWLFSKTSNLFPELLVYFALVLIVGLLAEVKAVRAEAYAMATIIEGLHTGSGFDPALRTLCAKGLRLYGANEIMVAIHERTRRRSFVFRINSSQPAPQPSELDASQLPHYFFPAPATNWRLVRLLHRSCPEFLCDVLESGQMTRKKTGCAIPDPFLAAHPFRILLASSLTFDNDMTARVYMIDPVPLFCGRAGLRYLDRAVRQAAPVLYAMFLVNQLRTRAEAAASSRIARELHDGIIQSLCSIKMQLEELRNNTGDVFARGADPLGRIQDSVEKEIGELREMTQQLRAQEIDSGRLLGYLAGLATKFQCQHGITARFVSEVDEVAMQPHVCVELARIVQEALVNVRKHSQAGEVLIRFFNRNGTWVLNVMDNGRGFGFSGRLSHEELQSSGKGPIVIMERARKINGQVSIESFENGGACLEVSIPRDDIS